MRRALDVLCAAGLVFREGTGPRTVWSRLPGTLDDAAERHGATGRHRLLLATINTEREAWHAITRRARATARTRLGYLHARQHATTAVAGPPMLEQLPLFSVVSALDSAGDARDVARRVRGGRDDISRSAG